VLVVWGYYDESGEYDGRGNLLNMTIEGCFASPDRWRKFDSEWQRALADRGPTYFHTTDFEAWKPPFDFMLNDYARDQAKHHRLLRAGRVNWAMAVMSAHPRITGGMVRVANLCDGPVSVWKEAARSAPAAVRLGNK
jgi:hypothetical protein